MENIKPNLDFLFFNRDPMPINAKNKNMGTLKLFNTQFNESISQNGTNESDVTEETEETALEGVISAQNA